MNCYKQLGQKLLFFVCTINLIIIAGCSIASIIGGSIENNTLEDGLYEGSYAKGPNKVVVKVTIQDNKIITIKVLKNRGSWLAKRVIPVIPDRIIETQSTEVDAVSGATNSSHVFMNAVQMAINKATIKK